MKVVYCIDSLVSSGGTERVAATKLNWLATQKDINLTLIKRMEDGEPFFPLSSKIRIISIDVPNKESYCKRLEHILFSLRPDVTVVIGGWAVDCLPFIKDGSKKVLEFHYTKNFLVNFVKGLHNIRFKKLHLIKMYWLQWRLAQTAKKYDAFVGLTQRDVNLWGNPKNMTYIYNPLSFRSEKKSTCESHKIIAVGSFTPAKGMDQLLHAFGRIAHRNLDWSLDIYGSGQDLNFMKDLISKYKIDNQVHIYPPTQNIAEKLVAASIYAFPSRSDGFGLVITEAMECALPIVAFDCECGPREIITSDTGIIVPDQNIDAFAHAMEKLMTNDNLRKEIGTHASQHVKAFYCENIMPKWLNLFNKLVRE